MMPVRYTLKRVSRPWYWVFSFWRKKWHKLKWVEVLPDDPEYNKAELEGTFIFHPYVFKSLVNDLDRK